MGSDIVRKSSGLKLKAILIGWLVGIVSTKYLGAFVINFVGTVTSETSFGQRLALLLGSGGAKAAYYIMSCSFTAFGGYLTALLAAKSEVRNAAVMGCLSLLAVLLIGFFTNSAQDLRDPYWIAYICFIVPSASLGGYMRVLMLKQQPPIESIRKEGKLWSRLSYPNSLPVICGSLGFVMSASCYVGVLVLAGILTGTLSSTWVLGLGFIPMFAIQPAFICFFIGCLIWPVFRCIYAPRPISERLYSVMLRVFVLSAVVSGIIGTVKGITTPLKDILS